ncbi:MAG TPA: potassium-transporting ATPase subunit C [Methylomirabilota bacterium]|nr:potassium-transporting ATPase subunit C [Methylomirabilota bacterium]
MKSLVASIRLVIVTMLICVAGYTALILGFAQIVTPDTAEGSLIKDKDGKIVGSHLIAQSFTSAVYFWPRPSAVGYNAAGAGGSNKSPTSSDIADRVRTNTIPQYGATAEKPLPADLAAASGGGLDPHITERAAMYQAERVAKARGIPLSQVEALVKNQAFSPGGALTPDRLVNVLELNLALDRK